MSEHTPGPWHVQYDTNVMADKRAVANCSAYSTNGPDQLDVIYENQANARLIAAAPDLLDACEAVMNLVDAGECSDGYTADQVRAAIAKARGRSE